MFHSQLIGGLSVGFKPVSGSPYTVTIHDVGKTLRATANTIFNVGQLGATDGSVISFENPTSYVITVQGIDGVTIQNEPVPVLANSTVSIVKISNTAWRLHSSGSGSGGGSGGAVRQWDLTPTTVPAQATVMPIPAPYLNIIYNPAGVVGTQYNAEWVAIPVGYSLEMSVVTLAIAPFTGDSAFWWKPMVGGVANALQIMDSSLNATFAMFVHPTLGLHAQTFGYNDFIDSAFVEGDVVLVQISNAGQISIKTANLPTTTIVDTITIAAGDSIVALGSMHPTNAPTITGQLAGSDLGSGIVPDVGYVAITTQAPAGLPAQSANGDILQITVPGTYNGVPFAVNEGAMVMDADNGLVAPMVYESVIQPVSYELLTIGVGPLEEYKSLKTLHTELINKGIFAKFLYIVYKDTTIEDSLDLSFPTCQGVIILTDTGLNNVVTNNNCYLSAQGTNTHGIFFEGEWHLGTFIARNLRLGGKIYASTSMDIINLECISSTAELHLNSGSYQNGIQITNFHSFTPIIQSTPTRCKFFCNNGTEYGNIVLRGTTEAYTLETNGCTVVLKGGNHKFGLTYKHINDTFVNPHQVVLVTEMATCFASIAVPNPNAWADIPRGIELVSGLVTAPSITGSVTTAYSQTPGTITSNGIIFG